MKQGSALILAAHGSASDIRAGDIRAGELVRWHAESLRGRGIFSEVQECFWRGEPSLGAGLRKIQSKEVFIVPFFIGHGHFVDRVLPNEFELTGRVTKKEGRKIFYCEPVGMHPNMTRVVLHRAEEVVNDVALEKDQISLLIVGHGNHKSESSAAVVHEQAAKIRAMKLFGECRAIFMEQSPYAKDWIQCAKFPNVIIVPFFISAGRHVTRDIPHMLGIKKGENNPHVIQDKKLWYADPIGTDPMITEIVLDQVNHVRATYF